MAIAGGGWSTAAQVGVWGREGWQLAGQDTWRGGFGDRMAGRVWRLCRAPGGGSFGTGFLASGGDGWSTAAQVSLWRGGGWQLTEQDMWRGGFGNRMAGRVWRRAGTPDRDWRRPERWLLFLQENWRVGWGDRGKGRDGTGDGQMTGLQDEVGVWNRSVGGCWRRLEHRSREVWGRL